MLGSASPAGQGRGSLGGWVGGRGGRRERLVGGWLCPSFPHRELRCVPRGWQSPGPVVSKASLPPSIFPNLSPPSRVMLLRSPSTPFCSPRLRGASPGQAHRARLPTLSRAEEPPPPPTGCGCRSPVCRGLGAGLPAAPWGRPDIIGLGLSSALRAVAD